MCHRGSARLHGAVAAQLITHPMRTPHVYRLIKEFEFEARADGMPAPLLAERKRELVNQINGFIAMKKEVSAAQSAKNELITGGPQHREEDLAGEHAGWPCTWRLHTARLSIAVLCTMHNMGEGAQ